MKSRFNFAETRALALARLAPLPEDRLTPEELAQWISSPDWRPLRPARRERLYDARACFRWGLLWGLVAAVGLTLFVAWRGSIFNG